MGGGKENRMWRGGGTELKDPLPVNEPAAPAGHQGEVQLLGRREGQRGLTGGRGGVYQVSDTEANELTEISPPRSYFPSFSSQ